MAHPGTPTQNLDFDALGSGGLCVGDANGENRTPANMNEDFEDLLASLRWAAELPLAPSQRESLKELCLRIAGISPEPSIPSWRLKQEADAKREAIARAEAAKGAQEWPVFGLLTSRP